MSEKRKISIRKVLQTLVTMIVVSGCLVAMISADRLQRSKKVKSVSVRIRNSDKVHFLDEPQVMNLLFSDRNIDPKDVRLGNLDIHKMETIARTNPWVSDAQVYVDNERNMHVYITQRVPVARLFEANGNSYYLDTALRSMPLSTTYVHYTPVVTGAPQLRDDSTGLVQKGTILSLVSYITRHPFWNAQIAQIVVAGDDNFELIPVLGRQRILLGDTARLEAKLGNLFAFYQQVCNKVGWDKYQTIDLRYDGQVVASPSLRWKAPVDRALSNMNWVKAVLEAGDKKERDEAAITDSTARVPSASTVHQSVAAAVSIPAAVKPRTVVAPPAAANAAHAPAGNAKPKEKVRPSAAGHSSRPALASKPKTTKPAEKKPAKKDPRKEREKKIKPGEKGKKKLTDSKNKLTNH